MVTSSRSARGTRRAERPHRFHTKIFCSLLLLLVLTSTGVSGTAKAEIPHENYDIANPDLGTVVNLLNTSIRASEETLKEFYNATLDEAETHLSMVDSILVPAQQVLAKIEYVASSYENLSNLLPPFLDLRAEMGSFSSLETGLLDARARLVSLSNLANLSDAELIDALATISTVNTLIRNLNSTIDAMLVSAGQINNLTVESRTPFTPNSLKPLIEKLRDMLDRIEAEIEPIIHDDMPWNPDRSFLLLWIADTSVYLGERIVGGGYLFYNGSFREHHLIHILWDSSEITGTTTDADGMYGFTLQLSLNASLLGQHRVMATARTPYVNLSSDEIVVTVLLMPTYMSLNLNKREMSVNETVTATLSLTDVYGRPVPNATCQLDYAGHDSSAITDNNGRITRSLTGSQLGFGSHSFSASYPAELPYSPSSAGPLTVTISIPTHFEFGLFSEKFVPGYYIVGAGLLVANSSQPLPAQRISVYIDERLVLNASTDALGEFALSIPSTDLGGGAHTLRVAFVGHGVIWRYCEIEVPFLITTMHKGGYPFFPFFPGWQNMPPDTIAYVFFGPYAYYVWLLMLVVLAIIVKTVQIRKARGSAPKDSLVVTPISEPSLAAASEPEPYADEIPDWTADSESPRDPNGRIVWLYNMLLEFLRRRKRVTITDDMTHWEVARLLRRIGFPKDSVERVTMLFEKAYYSGAQMSEVDSVGMSVAMDGLRSGGVKDAR